MFSPPFPSLLMASPQAHRPKRYLIDPFAFTMALIIAPPLVAVLGFWALLIPVFAIPMGGPLYLAAGIPALLWLMPKTGPNPIKIAMAAFVVNLAASALLLLPDPDRFEALTGFSQENIPVFYLGFGSLMAPIWGATFAKLYPLFERTSFRALNS